MFYKKIYKLAKNKKVILVDFFDTVMFRKVHPLQVCEQWAVCVTRKYPAIHRIGNNSLLQIRQSAVNKLKRDYIEPPYEAIIGVVFNMLLEVGGITSDDIGECSDFIRISHTIEVSLEKGVLFPNNKMVKFLRKMKQEDKRIYCVSDTHYSREDLLLFSENAAIIDCFDNIFLSSEFDLQKSMGQFYQIILDQLNVKADEVMMIGDNRISDGVMANKSGISSVVISNVVQKIKNQISLRLKIRKYTSTVLDSTIKQCYTNGKPYSEYVVLFFVFIRRLFNELHADQAKSVAFLSREGYYLLNLFDKYQDICIPKDYCISTTYLKCSRRAIYTLQPDKLTPGFLGPISINNWFKAIGVTSNEVSAAVDLSQFDLDLVESLDESFAYKYLMNHSGFKRLMEQQLVQSKLAFLAYINQYTVDNKLHVVDVGWTGRMQQGIAKIMGLNTKGYYLGIKDESDDPYPYIRKGLIFSNDRKKSHYFDILRANIQLYEQLLAAPHGSALRYILNDLNQVEVVEEWPEEEEKLYVNTIAEIQSFMQNVFESLCVWSVEDTSFSGENRKLARLVLKSALFANKERIEFLRKLDSSFVWNFAQEQVGINLDISKANLKIAQIIIDPALYTRYYAKLERYFVSKNPLFSILYFPIACLIYDYILFNQFLRMAFRLRY